MKKKYFLMIILIVAISSCNNTKYTSPVTVEFTIQSSDWAAAGTSGSPNYLYYHQQSMPGITDGVVASGAILGYVKTGSSYWAALPYTETNNSYTSNYNYSYETGDVLIIRKDSDLLTSTPIGSITVKIIILTEKEMHLVNGVDINNYQEVSNVLNLDK
jgi:hypothetical protein